MPRSYSIFEVTQMPPLSAEQEITIPYQEALIDGVEAPKSSLKVQRLLRESGIYIFRIKFEQVEIKTGRAKNVTFTEFVATYNFPGYFASAKRYFLVQAPKEVGRGAIRQILKSAPDISGYTKKVDLNSVRSVIESFKGVWFTVEKNADVKSQAFFGPSVERDPRFDQAMNEGTMRHIRFEYPFNGETFGVGISNDYGLVVYDKNMDEALELDLIDSIKTNLLDVAKEVDRPISS